MQTVKYATVDGKDLAYCQLFDWQWAYWINKNYNEEAFIQSIKDDIKRYLVEGITPEELDKLEDK